jgi:hypothetical protein
VPTDEPRAMTIDRTALRRFIDAVLELSERPTTPNVARYLLASTELDRAAPKPRPIRSSRPRSALGARSTA